MLFGPKLSLGTGEVSPEGFASIQLNSESTLACYLNRCTVMQVSNNNLTVSAELTYTTSDAAGVKIALAPLDGTGRAALCYRLNTTFPSIECTVLTRTDTGLQRSSSLSDWRMTGADLPVMAKLDTDKLVLCFREKDGQWSSGSGRCRIMVAAGQDLTFGVSRLYLPFTATYH